MNVRMVVGGGLVLAMLLGQDLHARPWGGDRHQMSPVSPAMNRSMGVEGELAMIHARLGVTPAQEAAWTRYAESMRGLAALMAEPSLPPPAGVRPDALVRAERALARQETQLAARRGVLEAFKGLHALLDLRQRAVAEQIPQLLGCGGR